MNRNQVKVLRDVIQKALNDTTIGKDLNVNMVVGNASYGEDNCTFKLEVADIVNGKAVSKTASDFKIYAPSVGLKATDLGRKFTNPYNGKVFEIVGYKARGRKYPILANDIATGQRYKFGASMVKKLLEDKDESPSNKK